MQDLTNTTCTKCNQGKLVFSGYAILNGMYSLKHPLLSCSYCALLFNQFTEANKADLVEDVVNYIESKEYGMTSFEAASFYSQIIERLEAMRDGAESANEWD